MQLSPVFRAAGLYLCLGNACLIAQPKSMKPLEGTAPIGTERRLALVIGNKDYQNLPPLTNTLNDADDMARALEKLGFEVILRKNLRLTDLS
jgi:hypothetical protein